MAMDPEQSASDVAHMAASFPPPSTPLPPWHFPFGPSSRYHQRERPKSGHARVKSQYTPTAPTFSTAERAHRRTRSTASTALARDYNTTRSPLSRFPTYTGASMSNVASFPVTPAKQLHSNTMLPESPFSDYFTDESARSVNRDAPSLATQQLLVRLQKLQSRLVRGEMENDPDALSHVHRKLSEIELAMIGATSHFSSPGSPDTRDPQSFMEDVRDEEGEKQDEDEEEEATPAAPRHSATASFSLDGTADEPDTSPTTSSTLSLPGDLQSQLTSLLKELTHAQSELRQRCIDVRETNERNAACLEGKNQQIEHLRVENESIRAGLEFEHLRMENESLKTDLGFEHNELLFLMLQLKSLEIEVGDMNESHPTEDPASSCERRDRKSRIYAEIEGWRTDWQDVSMRCRRRQRKYDVQSSTLQGQAHDQDAVTGAEQHVEEEPDWQIQTVSEQQGRVTSLTVTRHNSNLGHDELTDIDPTSPTRKQRRSFESHPAQHLTEDVAEQKSAEPDIDRERNPVSQSTQILDFSTLCSTCDRGTQTEHPDDLASIPEESLFPSRPMSEYGADDDQDNNNNNNNNNNIPDDEEDCAITTSTESMYDSDDERARRDMRRGRERDCSSLPNYELFAQMVEACRRPSSSPERPVKVVGRRKRTAAWRELWSSLSEFAGMEMW